MKKKVKVYFDFLCPYCFKGILDLISLLPAYPDITIDWYPCEAHPRPEKADQYSDLAAEALLYLKGHKGDVISYIRKLYFAAFIEKNRIDDKELLIQLADGCDVDLARMKASMIRRDYRQDVIAINSDIWDVYCAHAVPSYYNRNHMLESRENQLISKEQLKEYLDHVV